MLVLTVHWPELRRIKPIFTLENLLNIGAEDQGRTNLIALGLEVEVRRITPGPGYWGESCFLSCWIGHRSASGPFSHLNLNKGSVHCCCYYP